MKRGKMKLGSSIPKTSRLSQVLKLAACGTLGLGAAQSRAETTITFEGFTSDNVSIGSILGYGNNVTADSADWNVAQGIAHIVGTPNITLDWSAPGWDTYTSWDGRGNVAQTDFNAGPEMGLLFTPSGGAAVRIVSFQLDAWHGGGDGSINWAVVGSTSGLLASGNWTMSTAGGRSTLNPDVTGLPGEVVTLGFELRSGAPSYFAMDNLSFDQVPEPSTFAIGALGVAVLGAAAMRRHRRA